MTPSSMRRLLLALFVAPVAAFWRTGHLLVSHIAYANMTTGLQSTVDRLATALDHASPPVAGFAYCSPWMDQIKDSGLHLFDHLHYQGDPASCRNDLATGLNTAFKVLEETKDNTFAGSFALRLAAHTMGDLHQPLHVDDRNVGGNTFFIRGQYPNLHALFDAGCGAWDEISYPLDDAKRAYLIGAAKELMAAYAFEPEWIQGGLKEWVQEGVALADAIYKDIRPNTEPSPEFIRTWQGVMRRQVVKAGYRLSAMLAKSISWRPHLKAASSLSAQVVQ